MVRANERKDIKCTWDVHDNLDIVANADASLPHTALGRPLLWLVLPHASRLAVLSSPQPGVPKSNIYSCEDIQIVLWKRTDNGTSQKSKSKPVARSQHPTLVLTASDMPTTCLACLSVYCQHHCLQQQAHQQPSSASRYPCPCMHAQPLCVPSGVTRNIHCSDCKSLAGPPTGTT